MIFGLRGKQEMTVSKHSEAQIIGALKQIEAGRTAADVARECGVSKHTIYAWKAKYGGMEVNEAQRLRSLEDENARLKRLVADLSLDREMLKAVIAKKASARRPEDGRQLAAVAAPSQRAPGVRADVDCREQLSLSVETM